MSSRLESLRSKRLDPSSSALSSEGPLVVHAVPRPIWLRSCRLGSREHISWGAARRPQEARRASRGAHERLVNAWSELAPGNNVYIYIYIYIYVLLTIIPRPPPQVCGTSLAAPLSYILGGGWACPELVPGRRTLAQYNC